MKAIVRRLGVVVLAGFFALTVTGLSVAAADPAPGQVGVIYNTNSVAYQQTVADVRAQQFLGYYGYGFNGFGYGYSNPSLFAAAGCNSGNFTCLANAGVPYAYGYNNFNGGTPFYGYNGGYGYGNGIIPFYGYNNYAYPGFNSYNYGYGNSNVGGGAPLYGYALNYNFNFPYSGLPNTYFTTASCAVGNYTCLFGNLGMSASLPNSFFDAVGCPQGNYACATDQSVFTNKGCTIGNYACVFMKTGKTP